MVEEPPVEISGMGLIGWFARVPLGKDFGCASLRSERLVQRQKVNPQRSRHKTTVIHTQGASSKPTESFRLVTLMIDCCFVFFHRVFRRRRGSIRPRPVYLF